MIDSIDFANMYREHKIASTFKGKSATDWDEKAESMNKRVIDSPYTAEFISKMNLDGCESVLDVGCGPGTIALALAPKMQKVCGVDYSTGMLDCFMKNAESRGLGSARCLLRSWEDDWADIEPCDVVVASRSIEVKDLKDALKKLDAKAKKGVYITYKAGGSFVDEEILQFIGKQIVTRPDYVYVLLILRQMGIYAKLDFIDTPGGSVSYDTQEAFVNSLTWSVGGLDEEQTNKAKEMYEKFIATGKYTPKGFKWAFIYWEK